MTATCSREEYADWLHAMMVLHMAADVTLPLWMHRHSLFLADLALLPPPIPCPQPFHYASQLLGTRDIRGAQYVLHGAHRTGGRVMAPVLAAAGLPSTHIAYADPGSVQAMIKKMRDIRDPRTLHSANWTFRTLLSVMDTLEQRHAIRSMRDDQTPAPDEEPASAPVA